MANTVADVLWGLGHGSLAGGHFMLFCRLAAVESAAIYANSPSTER